MSDVAASGRWDAQYHLLLAEHKDVYEELLEKFTPNELVALAKQLPYDHRAACAVCPGMTGGGFGHARGQHYFFEYLDSFIWKKVQKERNEWTDEDYTQMDKHPGYKPTKLVPKGMQLRTKYREVATYIAAACQMAVSKVLENMLELKQKELELLQGAKAFLQVAKDKDAPILGNAMKNGSQAALKSLS
jgi:hypothetical protein